MRYRLPEINDDSFCFDTEHQTGEGRASCRPWVDDFLFNTAAQIVFLFLIYSSPLMLLEVFMTNGCTDL